MITMTTMRAMICLTLMMMRNNEKKKEKYAQDSSGNVCNEWVIDNDDRMTNR